MRLLHAELRKLNRPLFWCTALGFALFAVLLAVGGASNAQQYTQTSPVPGCAAMHLPASISCAEAQRTAEAREEQTRPERLASALHTAEQLTPLAGGAESAGLMASLPGVLVLSLLAGGHVGGEWTGHTLKSLLAQCGRRRRVLAAKVASLWLAAVGIMAAGWAGLALAGPLAAHVAGLPAGRLSLAHTVDRSAGQLGRALLVLALFAAVGVLCSVLTRSTVGTLGACSGVFVALLATAALPGLGRWTPATWVQNWMGFGAGESSITALPDNFWSRFLSATGAAPSPLVTALEAVALAGTAAACALVADTVFRRSDVTG
ncbi:ABC transporter permease subunit [Streptacidiphilus carbonis]|uniref:ABC transporter permease subunit n=1 Tax=Streptacidiphilus carbonis TaxID=105422 RepID=UPI0005A87B2B|nr:ABC transporter permease subunit [Streptacidiphilus carbonis]